MAGRGEGQSLPALTCHNMDLGGLRALLLSDVSYNTICTANSKVKMATLEDFLLCPALPCPGHA